MKLLEDGWEIEEKGLPFKLDPYFAHHLDPILDSDLSDLEELICKHGILPYSLKVWKEGNVLIDGHHCLAICQKHNKSFGEILYKSFPNKEEALEWLCDNQNARRSNPANSILMVKNTIEKLENYEIEKADKRKKSGIKQTLTPMGVKVKQVSKYLAHLAHASQNSIDRYTYLRKYSPRLNEYRGKVYPNIVPEEVMGKVDSGKLQLAPTILHWKNVVEILDKIKKGKISKEAIALIIDVENQAKFIEIVLVVGMPIKEVPFDIQEEVAAVCAKKDDFRVNTIDRLLRQALAMLTAFEEKFTIFEIDDLFQAFDNTQLEIEYGTAIEKLIEAIEKRMKKGIKQYHLGAEEANSIRAHLISLSKLTDGDFSDINLELKIEFQDAIYRLIASVREIYDEGKREVKLLLDSKNN